MRMRETEENRSDVDRTWCGVGTCEERRCGDRTCDAGNVKMSKLYREHL